MCCITQNPAGWRKTNIQLLKVPQVCVLLEPPSNPEGSLCPLYTGVKHETEGCSDRPQTSLVFPPVPQPDSLPQALNKRPVLSQALGLPALSSEWQADP